MGPGIGGVLVASVDFTKSVKRQCETDGVRLFTISQLEKSLVDFHGYVKNMIVSLERDKVLASFIQPTLMLQESGKTAPAAEYFNQWLADPETNHLTLLGDYGTGKSTLLKWLALQSARSYEEEVINKGARGRAPILVNLGELPLVTSLQEIADAAFRSQGVRYSSFEAFEYALSNGQILLLLDSFDEMAGRGRPKEVLRAFRTMNRSALGKAKIVLSSRTHYFSSGSDVRHLMGDDEPSTIAIGLQSQLMRDIAPRRNFVITHLRDFDTPQVEECVKSRCGEESNEVLATIDSIFNLRELSRRPVLLDMIITQHRKLEDKKGKVTPGYLYHLYTHDCSRGTIYALLSRSNEKPNSSSGSPKEYREIPRLNCITRKYQISFESGILGSERPLQKKSIVNSALLHFFSGTVMEISGFRTLRFKTFSWQGISCRLRNEATSANGRTASSSQMCIFFCAIL